MPHLPYYPVHILTNKHRDWIIDKRLNLSAPTRSVSAVFTGQIISPKLIACNRLISFFLFIKLHINSMTWYFSKFNFCSCSQKFSLALQISYALCTCLHPLSTPRARAWTLHFFHLLLNASFSHFMQFGQVWRYISLFLFNGHKTLPFVVPNCPFAVLQWSVGKGFIQSRRIQREEFP